MSAEFQFSCLPTFKDFVAFQANLSTNVRMPKFSSMSRERKNFAGFRALKARGLLASCCLQPNQPNHEDLSPKHQPEDDGDQTRVTNSEFGFILTSIVTATAGGPALTVWGLFFLILGKYTGTPTWLQAISTCIFAGITDALVYNWTSFSFDAGFTPFFVFFVGCGATLLYESTTLSISAEDSGHLSFTNNSNQESARRDGASHNHDIPRDASKPGNELANWDHAFNQARRDNDGNSE